MATSIYDIDKANPEDYTDFYNKYQEKVAAGGIENPYVRGLALYGIQAGLDSGSLITQTGQEAEIARRTKDLTTSVVEPLRAEETRAGVDISNLMEKQGKLSSSGAITTMKESSELYRARMAGALATGKLGIYEQVGALASEERNRLYGAGVEQMKAETGMYQTEMGTVSGEKIAGTQAQLQMDIAVIDDKLARWTTQEQTESAQRIAQIQADTTLSAVDKNNAIEMERTASGERQNTANNLAAGQRNDASNANSLAVANVGINPDTGVPYSVELAEKQTINPDTGKPYSNEEFNKLYINPATGKPYSNEEFLAKNINPLTGKPWEAEEFYDALEQQKYEFNLTETTTDADGKIIPRWLAELSESKRSDMAKLKVATDQLEENKRQFNLSEYNSNQEFRMNLQYLKDKYSADNATVANIAEKQLAENAREFDLTRSSDRDQFKESLAWMKESFGVEDSRIKNIAANQLHEQMRQFDLISDPTNANSQFSKSLEWAQTEFNITNVNPDTGKAYVQEYALEQTRQFNVKTTNDFLIATQQLADTMTMFKMEDTLRRDTLMESLKIQRESMTDSNMANRVDQVITLLSSPAALLATKDEKEFMSNLVFDIITIEDPDELKRVMDEARKYLGAKEKEKTGGGRVPKWDRTGRRMVYE